MSDSPLLVAADATASTAALAPACPPSDLSPAAAPAADHTPPGVTAAPTHFLAELRAVHGVIPPGQAFLP